MENIVLFFFLSFPGACRSSYQGNKSVCSANCSEWMNVFQDGMRDGVICILRRKESCTWMLHVFRLCGTVTFLSLCHPTLIYMLHQSPSPYFVRTLHPDLNSSCFLNFYSCFCHILYFSIYQISSTSLSFLRSRYLVFCSPATCNQILSFSVKLWLVPVTPVRRWRGRQAREESDRQRRGGIEWGEIGVFVTVNLMSLESGQPEQAADGRPPQQAHGATHLCPVLKQAHTPGPEPPRRVIATRT